MKRGEMTAFISLVFVLLVGLIGAVIESASVQTAKNYRRADIGSSAAVSICRVSQRASVRI